MKRKLLIYSDDHRANTGFATELRPLLKYLQKEYDVYYFGVFGANDTDNPVKTFGAGAINKEDSFGTERFEKVVQEIKPDFVLSNQDFQVIHNIVLPACAKNNVPIVNWDIIDCDDLPNTYWQTCMEIDWHIYQTKYCKNAIEKQIGYIKAVDASVIYPPVSEFFFDLEKQPHDEKIVLYIAKNAQRKFIPTFMEAAYILQQKGINDVKFVLHTMFDPPDHPNPEPKIDLFSVLAKFKLTNFSLTQELYKKPILEESEMKHLFSITDLLVMPSGREGVGIPILEAFAANIPVIGTNHSATGELLSEDRGLLLQPMAYAYEVGSGNITNAVVSPGHLAKGIYGAFFDEKLKNALSDNSKTARWFVNNCQPQIVAKRMIDELKKAESSFSKRKKYVQTVHFM